jgi:hypothetical protein
MYLRLHFTLLLFPRTVPGIITQKSSSKATTRLSHKKSWKIEHKIHNIYDAVGLTTCELHQRVINRPTKFHETDPLNRSNHAVSSQV